jgi:hypothetical protein
MPASLPGLKGPRAARPAALALLPVVVLLLSGCGNDSAPPAGGEPSPRVAWGSPAPAAYLPSDEHETEADWAIARAAVEWGREQDLDLLPVGEVVAMMGMTFLGTTYEPGTLELPGEEALVVNLRAFDCVTLVEHLLVLARLVVAADETVLADESAFREHYRSELTRLRYRDGRIDGYPSRLHYFSDWIRNGERKGWVSDVTADLGGIRDDRPIHFMTSNPTAYRQLQEDPANVEAIAAVEARLNAEPRYFIPQEEIAAAAPGIRNGDVIAAVSTLEGLDIAHTGIALWHSGRLHLLHAPLVGETVELSARPLAERMMGISSQKGIMVARPLDP